MSSVLLLSALHALFFGRYDLVHLHNFEAGFIVPLLRLRFPVVATSHGPAYLREKWGGPAKALMRLCDVLSVRGARAVTAVSRPQAESYARRFGREVRWIPNGVEQPLPHDEEAARRFLRASGAPEDGFLLFLAGRILPSKGLHLLLQAAASLPDLPRLVVVGDLAAMPAYEREIRTMAPPGTVFLGFVDDPALLFGIALCARVFVFPSLVEAMSMALLEVISLGVPALISDIPENRSVFEPAHVVFFHSGDAADLANGLREIMADPVGADRRAAAAREFLERSYRWPGIARQYEETYRGVLGGQGGPN
jgi:glycosyltransferase involved in cell wall biosynthesis